MIDLGSSSIIDDRGTCDCCLFRRPGSTVIPFGRKSETRWVGTETQENNESEEETGRRNKATRTWRTGMDRV
jgi:hypothetical protein